jgi:hypothetical protein
MRVIGLTGFAQSGKDTVADILAIRYGLQKMGMADPIYKIAYEHFNWNGIKDDPGRKLLQDIGTAGRAYYKNIWVKKMIDTLALIKARSYLYPLNEKGVVICGIRYPNEISMVKDFGGYIWRVSGRGGLVGDNAHHESEQHIKTFKPDAEIDNSGTKQDLERVVIELYGKIR